MKSQLIEGIYLLLFLTSHFIFRQYVIIKNQSNSRHYGDGNEAKLI